MIWLVGVLVLCAWCYYIDQYWNGMIEKKGFKAVNASNDKISWGLFVTGTDKPDNENDARPFIGGYFVSLVWPVMLPPIVLYYIIKKPWLWTMRTLKSMAEHSVEKELERIPVEQLKKEIEREYPNVKEVTRELILKDKIKEQS